VIPKTVKIIGENCFEKWHSLISVLILNPEISIGKDFF
jgi:hypothetical protein